MATAGSFLSEDQFLCSICLDVFTQPVSIPCGHNFCHACIHRHWENQEQCQCPLCKEKFKKGLKLRVNIGFREVVENFKKHHASADNNSLAKPDQVPCDCCLGKKFKATKTCLVCLTSYCEIHLEPHLRVAALKRHTLTEPVHNLEDHICKIHNRMFEFSRNDQRYACDRCREHSSPETMSLEEAVVDKRAQVQKTNPRHRKKGQKPNKSMHTKSKGKDEAMSTVLNQMQDSPMWWIPDIFNGGSNVPGNTPPKGRFYRVCMSQESTSDDLGVAREPMRGIRTFMYPDNGNWVVRVGTIPREKAQHNIPTRCVLIKKSKRVMLIVDYDKGSVLCMYNNFTNLLFVLNGFHFNEMVYLFYRPDPSWTNRLQEKALNAWSHLPDTIFVLQCIGIFFVVVVFLCI